LVSLAAINWPANATELEECSFDDAQTQTNCYALNLQDADDDLNTVYSKLQRRLQAYEARSPDYEPKTSVILRNAQVEWIKFRDLACEAEAAAWSGTGSFITGIACQSRLTKRRTKDLEAILERCANCS